MTQPLHRVPFEYRRVRRMGLAASGYAHSASGVSVGRSRAMRRTAFRQLGSPRVAPGPHQQAVFGATRGRSRLLDYRAVNQTVPTPGAESTKNPRRALTLITPAEAAAGRR